MPQRRRQQQFTEVVGEDPDGRFIGAAFHPGSDLRFQRWTEQSFVAVFDGQLNLLGSGGVACYEETPQDTDRLFFGRRDAKGQEPLFFAATHGQHAVGRGG